MPALLLIHPIGVGLSSRFWDRFIQRWLGDHPEADLLAPDLIGCGEAACSLDPLTPEAWAKPLAALLRERNDGPVVLVSQGTSDEEWLQTLSEGSRAMNTRWAVFSFLAGFWRRDWEPQLTGLALPLQVVFGGSATGIGRSRSWDDLDERLATYRRKLPKAAIDTIPGRNVLSYESTDACVGCVSRWLSAQKWT